MEYFYIGFCGFFCSEFDKPFSIFQILCFIYTIMLRLGNLTMQLNEYTFKKSSPTLYTCDFTFVLIVLAWFQHLHLWNGFHS